MAAVGEAAQIIDALLARCITLSVGTPAYRFALPEIAFTPQQDANGKLVPYLKVDYFGNSPAWEGISSGKVAKGILLVTVVWPRGQGIVAPAGAAQTVIDHFAKGTVLSSGIAKVTVSREPWAASPISNDVDCRVPVTIPWTAVAA